MGKSDEFGPAHFTEERGMSYPAWQEMGFGDGHLAQLLAPKRWESSPPTVRTGVSRDCIP